MLIIDCKGLEGARFAGFLPIGMLSYIDLVKGKQTRGKYDYRLINYFPESTRELLRNIISSLILPVVLVELFVVLKTFFTNKLKSPGSKK